MKNKILLSIIAIAFCLTSCGESNHEDWQRKRDEEYAARITKFTYEGHTYLLYQYGAGNGKTTGITHDANCHCYDIPDSDFD